jgi:hypothetical protein
MALADTAAHGNAIACVMILGNTRADPGRRGASSVICFPCILRGEVATMERLQPLQRGDLDRLS